MTSKLLTLGGVALALLMLSAVFEPADARRGGHGHHHRWHGHHHHHGHGHHHHHRHRHLFLGAPFVYGGYYYGGYYGGDCYWLRRRAIYTGSRYWWNRYYACINGY
jgi:hypothetical protein